MLGTFQELGRFNAGDLTLLEYSEYALVVLTKLIEVVNYNWQPEKAQDSLHFEEEGRKRKSLLKSPLKYDKRTRALIICLYKSRKKLLPFRLVFKFMYSFILQQTKESVDQQTIKMQPIMMLSRHNNCPSCGFNGCLSRCLVHYIHSYYTTTTVISVKLQ